MKIFITIFLLLFALESFAEEHMLKESQYKYVEQSIGKGKPYFLEIGSEDCYGCKVMANSLSQVLQKNPQYNIHYINAKKERQVAKDLSVRMIPTQIIYDKDGVEVYRHIGIINKEELDTLFKKFMF